MPSFLFYHFSAPRATLGFIYRGALWGMVIYYENRIEIGLTDSQQNQLALIFGMMDFCCQIVATRNFDRPETLILCGLRDLGLYSHSMQFNAFCLIFVSPVRSRDSDSTDYLYSPCSTASVYHFFISVIKRLFGCG